MFVGKSCYDQLWTTLILVWPGFDSGFSVSFATGNKFLWSIWFNILTTKDTHTSPFLNTAKNAQTCLQAVNNFATGWLQLINNSQQTCQFHHVSTSLLKSGSLQLFICRLVTTYWNSLQQASVDIMFWQSVRWQLAKSLLTTCNKLIVIKQAVLSATDLLQLLRFWYVLAMYVSGYFNF